MYAVFQTGGKQYRVSKGQIIRLERLNIAVGKIIEFTEILMIVKDKKIEIGFPLINKNRIVAKVISNSLDKKIKIIKFHRRKHYRKQHGHRQWFTNVKIINIDKSITI